MKYFSKARLWDTEWLLHLTFHFVGSDGARIVWLDDYSLLYQRALNKENDKLRTLNTQFKAIREPKNFCDSPRIITDLL